MSVRMEIDSRELEALSEAFAAVDMDRVIERVIPYAAKMVETRMATYITEGGAMAPEGDYNRPGPYPKRWYQREFGPRWARKGLMEKARWVGEAGSVGGRNTSQELQKSWRTRIVKPGEAEVFTQSPKTGSEVSYVEYVHSYENQAVVHAKHGWHTDKQVAEEVEKSPALDRALEAEIERELRRMMG